VYVKGWQNGSGGFGLRVSIQDRGRYFRPEWDHVLVELEGAGTVSIPVSAAFWRTCIELRSAEVGRWLRSAGLAPWQKGAPPRIELTPVVGNRFTARF
jgi:hypothetical protein